ncbi:MAG: tetratricopeptide repeat protein [Planctomycetes bacterium]|nr:tetratricopeptide repeat protein [Planctomycetota bacterium]
MAKPPASQVLLKVKATLVDPSGGQEPQKVHPQVTAHHFWVADGCEMAVADIESVQQVDPQTVGVRRIGRGKELILRCPGADEARRLKACLVFHARETRGVATGAQQWTHLVGPRFDKLDVSDSAVPIVAPKPEALAGTAAGGGKLVAGIVVAAVVVAAVGIVLYATVFRGAGTDYAALRAEGDKAYQAGHYDQALDHYLKAQVGIAHDAELCGRIGQCRIKLAKHAEAIGPLVKAVSFDNGKTAEYSLLLAEAYEKTRQSERALTVLRNARNMFPADMAVAAALASAFSRKGDAQAAVRLSEEVYRRNPNDAGNERLYVSLLEKTERYEKAADVYLSMARKAPSYDFYVKAIRAAGKSGDVDRCESIIRQARRALPGNTQLARSDVDILVGLGLVQPPKPEPEPQPEPEPEPLPKPDGETQPGEQPVPSTTPSPSTEPGTEPVAEPAPSGGTTRTALPPPPEPEPQPAPSPEPSPEQPSETPADGAANGGQPVPEQPAP